MYSFLGYSNILFDLHVPFYNFNIHFDLLVMLWILSLFNSVGPLTIFLILFGLLVLLYIAIKYLPVNIFNISHLNPQINLIHFKYFFFILLISSLINLCCRVPLIKWCWCVKSGLKDAHTFPWLIDGGGGGGPLHPSLCVVQRDGQTDGRNQGHWWAVGVDEYLSEN